MSAPFRLTPNATRRFAELIDLVEGEGTTVTLSTKYVWPEEDDPIRLSQLIDMMNMRVITALEKQRLDLR